MVYVPWLRLKLMRFLLMHVAVSVTADMCEKSCMAHSGYWGRLPLTARLCSK